jgi:NADPH-dependent glutamate synthase beta subunit-like oxidoreductase
MTYHVAVVGSGPAGVYITEALAKGDAGKPLCKVDLFDRLPTPYGLVRSGVAPDHQGTKNVWRVFQRTLKRDRVVDAPAQEDHVLRVGEQVRQLLTAAVVIIHQRP